MLNRFTIGEWRFSRCRTTGSMHSASKLFAGNPAAVCPLNGEWPEDSLLQSIAFENNLAETAYFLPMNDGRFHLRWFTPGREVPVRPRDGRLGVRLMEHLEPGRKEVRFESRVRRAAGDAVKEIFSFSTFPRGLRDQWSVPPGWPKRSAFAPTRSSIPAGSLPHGGLSERVRSPALCPLRDS